MASDRWSFDGRVKRYRDEVSGKFLSRSSVVNLRDRALDAASNDARDLAGRAARGEISVTEFRDGMRQVIRRTETAQYVFGRGGKSAMTQADYGRLGARVKSQYRFLEGMVRDMANGVMSEKQAIARAVMYGNAGVESYERGQAAAWGIVRDLPGYPGDGSCDGKSNCRCGWRFEEDDDEVRAYWELNNDDPCGPCQRRASTWNPYVIRREATAA